MGGRRQKREERKIELNWGEVRIGKEGEKAGGVEAGRGSVRKEGPPGARSDGGSVGRNSRSLHSQLDSTHLAVSKPPRSINACGTSSVRA